MSDVANLDPVHLTADRWCRGGCWIGERWNDLPGDSMKRNPDDAEIAAIRRIALRLSPEQGQQLLEDLARSRAETVSPDGSRVTFEIAGYERPPYRGQRSFGVEGELVDRDGTPLSLDLFGDENGRLLELELVRWGEGDLLGPEWTTLKLF